MKIFSWYWHQYFIILFFQHNLTCIYIFGDFFSCPCCCDTVDKHIPACTNVAVSCKARSCNYWAHKWCLATWGPHSSNFSPYPKCWAHYPGNWDRCRDSPWPGSLWCRRREVWDRDCRGQRRSEVHFWRKSLGRRCHGRTCRSCSNADDSGALCPQLYGANLGICDKKIEKLLIRVLLIDYYQYIYHNQYRVQHRMKTVYINFLERGVGVLFFWHVIQEDNYVYVSSQKAGCQNITWTCWNPGKMVNIDFFKNHILKSTF